MALYANGVVDDTKQFNVWWDMDWNNAGVLKTDYDFDAGTNQIVIYGGEDCCEGK